jgi:cytoskeleton protein RodZ
MTESRDSTAGTGIGARLRAARERAGLSSLQAAAKLHLEPRMIEALEGEEFAVLGAPVYVRGHLRRYAELLDAPADELLAAYGAQAVASAAPDPAQLKPAESVRAPRQLAGPVVGIIVAATVIAGIWLALKGLPAAKLPVVAQAPAPASPPPAAPGVLPAAAATAVPAAAETAPEALVSPALPMSAASPMSASGSVVRLRLAIRSDSWVEVHDAGGKRLYYNLARAPETLTLAGAAPLRVLLGYADGVALEVEGRPIEVPGGLHRGRSASFAVSSKGTLGPLP